MSDEIPDPGALRARYRARIEADAAALAAESLATNDDRRPVELDQASVGRLSRMDAIQGQAMAAALDNRRHARLRALRTALDRLDGDDFGHCDDCGDFIGLRRLDLDPTVTRCVGCAR